MKIFTNFEMTHIVENEEPGERCRWYIDGYTECDDDEGVVIATVVLTEHNDIITNWHFNSYRLDPTVLQLIEKAKEQAKNKIDTVTITVKKFNSIDELKESLSEYFGGDTEELDNIPIFTDTASIKAIIGISHDKRIIYDYDLMMQHLMERDHMSYEEAAEFISYNTERTIPYMGSQSPMLVYHFLDY